MQRKAVLYRGRSVVRNDVGHPHQFTLDGLIFDSFYRCVSRRSLCKGMPDDLAALERCRMQRQSIEPKPRSFNRSYVYAAIVLSIFGSPAHAQTVSAVASGQWDAANTWSDNAVPIASNNYLIGSGFVVNSPSVPVAGNNATFTGGSLTVESGGTLVFPFNSGSTTTTNYTIPNFTMESGSSLLLSSPIGSPGATTFNLLTGLNLASSGSVTISNSHNAGSLRVGLTFSSTAVISGGADINLNLDAASGNSAFLAKNVTVSSANNPYSGNWIVTSINITPGIKQGALIANAANALGTGSVTLASSALQNLVAGGLDSIHGVNVGVNSLVLVSANWNDPTATLALTDPTAVVSVGGDVGSTHPNVAMSIGNLSGVSGSTITGAAANESLNTNITTNSEYAGTITGSLALTQSGPATLTLSGDNTYTGATNILAGTLQLGNGGTTGSIVGNVIDNGIRSRCRSWVRVLRSSHKRRQSGRTCVSATTTTALAMWRWAAPMVLPVAWVCAANGSCRHKTGSCGNPTWRLTSGAIGAVVVPPCLAIPPAMQVQHRWCRKPVAPSWPVA